MVLKFKSIMTILSIFNSTKFKQPLFQYAFRISISPSKEPYFEGDMRKDNLYIPNSHRTHIAALYGLYEHVYWSALR